GSVTFAIPTDWKMDSWGTYYKNTQGLEDAYRLPENSGHDSIADIASTSIFVSSSDAQGKTVDQLWEQDDDINDLNSTIVIAGERARISECGGLLYEECVYVVKGGVAYVINVRNVSVVKETADASARLLSQEIRQILHTMNFSR
ncbi:MAG: hypothetical protein Q7S89_02510, partial [bacterium]|nr:hypothetical protein [bacterium]